MIDGQMPTYSCFDFRLRCEFALPELSAAAAADASPLVEIRLGHVPVALAVETPPETGLEVMDGNALLTVPDTARYLVSDGTKITIEPLPGATPRMLRLFLLGSALGILAAQRGLLLLHANAVVVDGAVVAFAGPSGTGKSTLAAWFERAGYEVVADDVCAIRFDESGLPVAWPGLPRIKLWGEAIGALGIETSALEPVIDGLDKYQIPLRTKGSAPRPIPFRALCILARTAGNGPGSIDKLAGRAAFEAIIAQTYRGKYLGPLGLSAQHFAQASQLAARAEVLAVTRAWGFDAFEREAHRIERFLRRAAETACA